MCGFVGVVRDPALGPVTREELTALLPDLRHRGPDGAGVVVGHGVGLAATRLRIQGDERGDQPVVAGRIALALNGELLPPEQHALRAHLARLGDRVPDSAAGDSHLVAASFSAARARDGGLGGDAAAPVWRAIGRSMAALAVADLETGATWVARDRLGVKPLHVLESADARGAESWFASTLTPLLRVRERRGYAEGDDVLGLAELWLWQAPLRTLPFEGLRNASVGVAQRLGRALRVELVPTGDLEPSRTASREAGRERLEAALRASARDAAAVAGPVTLFLSGGLDSAAVAAECGRSDVLALTGRFAPAGGADDESAAAAAVAAAAGLRHEVVELRDADLVADLASVVRALELPVAGPGSLAAWRLARRAAEHGRVVLSGTGGDELLGGYARSAIALGRGGPWTRGYEGLADRLGAGTAAGTAAARALAGLDRRRDLADLFEPGFRALLTQVSEPEPFLANPAALDSVLEPERWITLPALLHVEDRVLMAHGLEGRPVFCLGDVPDAALALPEDEVIGPDGEGKVALRAVLAGRIPESVRTDRRKRGFPTPFGRAARGAGRESVEAILGDRRFRERGWWDVRACRALLDEDRPPHDRALFALLSWETWARLFVDGDAWRAPAPVAAPGAPGA
jgi:asparagine synthase (glutamine-hydrolysing)